MIPVYQPHFTGREKEYVNQCLDSTWISSKGEFIGRFERGFADYIGAKHATTVSNGTVAIHLALEAIGIGPGDEVIVPTLTYIASVNTILQTGATPVFVDSLEDTWQIDPEDIERKLSAKTKAIMAVHLYGLPCDMDTITAICRKHKLYLIEDCAEAFGTLYKGQHVGTFGDIATFSFFGNKTITTGEGGMVITKEEHILDKAYHLKNQGVSQAREYWHDTVAYNYRMTNICAAIGLAQLEQADKILAKKRIIATWYQEGLSALPLKTHQEQPDTRHSYWMFSVAVDQPAVRQLLREHLKQAGIETRPLFYPAHTLPHCSTDESFPIAESLASRGINLPSYPDLTREDVSQVIQAMRNFPGWS
ncbi:aminotransferase DegT [Pseudomonas sp. Pc102]|uniref:DegT/DnrJ/EryC1/StrS family aminotransferase n=1 Tax=Pseudomonas sp. Pc102 TaxID=2678261 RepID=UPI001BCE1929|nr:DegT/DnrJ/EryC1/StrS family aminotransferase [Pseudomonas sp. Pc102]BBP86041.1 aminotransferase DegT [Pseudomonas sp. Pc102]